MHNYNEENINKTKYIRDLCNFKFQLADGIGSNVKFDLARLQNV